MNKIQFMQQTLIGTSLSIMAETIGLIYLILSYGLEGAFNRISFIGCVAEIFIMLWAYMIGVFIAHCIIKGLKKTRGA